MTNISIKMQFINGLVDRFGLKFSNHYDNLCCKIRKNVFKTKTELNRKLCSSASFQCKQRTMSVRKYYLGKWIFEQMFSYTSTKSWRSFIFIAVCVWVYICLSVNKNSAKPMQWCTVSRNVKFKKVYSFGETASRNVSLIGPTPFLMADISWHTCVVGVLFDANWKG